MNYKKLREGFDFLIEIGGIAIMIYGAMRNENDIIQYGGLLYAFNVAHSARADCKESNAQIMNLNQRISDLENKVKEE